MWSLRMIVVAPADNRKIIAFMSVSFWQARRYVGCARHAADSDSGNHFRLKRKSAAFAAASAEAIDIVGRPRFSRSGTRRGKDLQRRPHSDRKRTSPRSLLRH